MYLRAIFTASLCFGLAAARLENVVARQGGYGGSPGSESEGGPNPSGSSTVVSATSTGASTSASGTSTASGTVVTGDSKCSISMCVTATVDGSSVEYALQSKGKLKLGWMAIGFGSTMANTPMVIMWPNSDGSVTVSQRKSSAEVMPTVDSNPPRVATFQKSLSTSTTDANPKFVFSVPANSDKSQKLIWAFGTTNPGSSDAKATLLQHSDFGTLTLNLTKTTTIAGSSDSSGSSGSSGSNSPSGSSSSNEPLSSREKMLVAHAIFLTLGFLVSLPAGALLARYIRTFTPKWFTGHWIIQFLIAGPVILIGFALGVRAVAETGGGHFDDRHKRLGLALFILYFVQIFSGAIIHKVKSKTRTSRPPQNYMHAVLGLVIIALSFYQVRYGFRSEWTETTGRRVGNGANVVWYIWVVVVPVGYFAGLAFLRKQYDQERWARQPRFPSNEERKGTSQEQFYRD